MMKTRIVILNYNGEEMLSQCLPSLVEAARSATTPTAITVLDNLSQDRSEAYVRTHFPEIDFVKASQNLVLCSYNAYLKTMTEPIAILLNNDIRVDRYFIDLLIKKFEEDSETFLVAPRVHTFDGKGIEAVGTRFCMRFGMPKISARYPGYEAHAMISGKTFASGFGAFSTKKFNMLGGYDRRYLPGIYEDADLCLRAQRAGYHLYYEPRSKVFHMGQASFNKTFSTLRRETIASRNTFLFVWKNFSEKSCLIKHLLFLPWRLLWALLKGRSHLLLGFWEAVWHKRKS